MSLAQRVAELLLAIEAVQLSVDRPFVWTSGIKSPIYCDNRMIYSHPDARDVIVHGLTQRVSGLHIPPDVIAGTATAAIGWAALVADRLKLPLVYVRAKAKEHGAKKRIEGDLPPGKHIVLIEDLISTGGSSIDSVAALRSEGQAIVTDVVAIFSYELLSSLESAQSHGVRLHLLTTLTTLLAVAHAAGSITAEDVKVIGEFAKDPQDWAKRL